MSQTISYESDDVGADMSTHAVPQFLMVAEDAREEAAVPDDGDGFTFGATIINGDAKRVTILYDYTGEVESWASALCKRWLEPDCDPLCRALESACLSGLNSASGRSVEPRLLSPPMLAMYAAGE